VVGKTIVVGNGVWGGGLLVVAASGVRGGEQNDCGSHFGVWGGGQSAEIRNSNADFRNFYTRFE